MKKSTSAFISILLIITVVFSSFAMFSSTAEEIKKECVWSEETPFIRYEDSEGIRYKGPVGNISTESNIAQTAFEADEAKESSEVVRDKGELAAVGESTPLPDSVDLSQSKYFPPVGNQGGLGSCATFSTTYYQLSYEMNRQRDVAATAENTRSPQLVYNLMSSDNTSGTYSEDNYNFLKWHGAPSMGLLPYSDTDRLSWYAFEEIWNDAMDCRVDESFSLGEIGTADTQITSPDDEDLTEVKSALASGNVLIYSTCIYSWVGAKIEAHPNAPENTKFVGEEIIKYQDGFNGAHSMTLVGYNDNIWVDQNDNNRVDAGEMGAFKIANSWGDGYANGGFCWVAYDAINKETSVEGGYSGVRGSALEYFKGITVKPYGQGSKIYARFTLNTKDRTQMDVHFVAEKNGIEESKRFLSSSNYKSDGNNYGFDGTTEATDGTFCFALDNASSELCAENFEDYCFSATIEDLKQDLIPLTVKKIEIVNEYTGKVYPMKCQPFDVDGEKVTVELKDANTTDKAVYYIGYDEPVLHYKSGDGDFTSVKMEYTEARHGYNYRYVIEDADQDITLYFSDENGRIDDNNGAYFTADQRLSFFRTKGAREPLSVNGFEYENGLPDISKRSWFLPQVSGGYEPYNFQYTFENLQTGETKQYAFDYLYDKSHAFYTAGKYKFTIDVMDQTGDIATYVEVLDIIDRPFIFAELTAESEYGEGLYAGENVHFDARTEFEDIISRGPFKSLYDFVIKDSSGNICYSETKKSYKYNLTDCVSRVELDWIPEKKGTYTISVSSTDDRKEYAEKVLTFTVFDKIYGDANGDGEVNVKDATAIQKNISGMELDFVFVAEFADCDSNGTVSVKDATCVRKYLAQMANSKEAGKIIEYVPPVTEPETSEPVTEPETEPKPVEKNIVTFTNSFNWGGTISCYYWSDSNKNMTTWPGKAMTNAGTNDFGETYYTYQLPADATYVIFTNGSNQTVDIPYAGGEVKYYPLPDTDSSGHYLVANW